MNENYETLIALFESLQKDYTKALEKGNKSAARRARITSSKIQKLLKVFRKDIIDNLYAKPE